MMLATLGSSRETRSVGRYRSSMWHLTVRPCAARQAQKLSVGDHSQSQLCLGLARPERERMHKGQSKSRHNDKMPRCNHRHLDRAEIKEEWSQQTRAVRMVHLLAALLQSRDRTQAVHWEALLDCHRAAIPTARQLLLNQRTQQHRDRSRSRSRAQDISLLDLVRSPQSQGWWTRVDHRVSKLPPVDVSKDHSSHTREESHQVIDGAVRLEVLPIK